MNVTSVYPHATDCRPGPAYFSMIDELTGRPQKTRRSNGVMSQRRLFNSMAEGADQGC